MKSFLSYRLLSLVALVPIAAFAQTVPLTQDAHVAPGTGTNFGTATAILVGSASNAQSLVQFDLRALPAGTTGARVAKATLSLFVNKVAAAGTVSISVANGAWTETAVNGTTGPVAGAAVASGLSVTTASTWLYVDATAAVQSWLDGITPNSGFIITPAGGGVSVAFDSKESTTTSHPAELTIILATSGPTGATGATGSNGTNGSTGATGATGSNGTNGSTGATGATGSNGTNGSTGATGATGSNGTNGTNGATGATGATGVTGLNGTNGATGTTGPTGLNGTNGTNGTNGATGPTGNNGPAGPTGPAGSSSFGGDGSDGTTANVCAITANTNWISNPPNSGVQCTNFSISGGITLTVPSGTVIHATGTVTISGALTVGDGSAAASSGLGHVAATPFKTSGGIALSTLSLRNELHAAGSGGGPGLPAGVYSNVANAGVGGGSVVIVAAGAVTVGAAGTINANGGVGTADGTALFAYGGGGGGLVVLASQTSVTNSGTINAKGGNGTAPLGANYSAGGGGGGGVVHLLGPTVTLGTVSAIAGSAGGADNGLGFAGGGGAGGGNGGAVATAGSGGLIFTTVLANPGTLFVP